MVDCGSLGPAFRFDNEKDAFDLAKTLFPDVRKHNPAPADMCEGGTHVNLRCGKEKKGSIVCCPCCEDTVSGILLQKKCAYLP